VVPLTIGLHAIFLACVGLGTIMAMLTANSERLVTCSCAYNTKMVINDFFPVHSQDEELFLDITPHLETNYFLLSRTHSSSKIINFERWLRCTTVHQHQQAPAPTPASASAAAAASTSTPASAATSTPASAPTSAPAPTPALAAPPRTSSTTHQHRH
jgi:hypothetical protein